MNVKSAILPAVLLAATLTGCKSSSDNKTVETESHNTGSASRLLVAADNSSDVMVVTVSNSQDQKKLTVNKPLTAIYTSPQNRYGLIVQSEQVQVIDGGIYQVPHEDHFDTEVKDPVVADKAFMEEQLIRYRAHESRATIVTQHSASELEALNFNDHAVAEVFESSTTKSAAESSAEHDHDHEGLRELDLTRMALVEPRGDQLVVVYNAESSAGAGDQVEIYHYHEEEGEQAKYEKEDEMISVTCSNPSTSFSLETASVFACADGVLVIAEEEHKEAASTVKVAANTQNTTSTSEAEHEHELTAEKIASDSVIDAFTAAAHGHVVGAWSGSKLYVMDLEHEHMASSSAGGEKMEQVDWNGDAADATKVAAVMANKGKTLVVLDNSGNLHILAAHDEHDEDSTTKSATATEEEHGFEYSSTMTGVLVDTAGTKMLASPVSDEVFVLDAVNKQVVVIHVDEKEVHERISLDFVPAHIAWVGVADGMAGHDHDHDHEGHTHN